MRVMRVPSLSIWVLVWADAARHWHARPGRALGGVYQVSIRVRTISGQISARSPGPMLASPRAQLWGLYVRTAMRNDDSRSFVADHIDSPRLCRELSRHISASRGCVDPQQSRGQP